MKNDEFKILTERLIQELTDKGLLLEAGWIGLRRMLPSKCSQIQITEMRKAFYFGAHHLFSSIMNFLEPGTEPTEKDMDRMSMIAAELQAFEDEMEKLVAQKQASNN